MLTDSEIRNAISVEDLAIEPLAESSLQAASYDFRVGSEAFVSGSDAVIDVATRGLVVVEPGEFALVTTLERVHCGPRAAGQLGLCSAHARQGLVLLSGPQIDPGFDGVLVVRITNLAPRRITLAYGASFLTTQFFRLSEPVVHPYSGSRQGQTGLSPDDIAELNHPDSPTIGGMVKTLATLASDVSDLKQAAKWMVWAIPILLVIGIGAMTAIAALK